MEREAKQDSLGKAFSLLRCFVDGQEEWGVRELASALRQPASSVHRLLRILRREGLLDFDDASHKYRAGLELVRIGSVVGQRFPLRRIASSVMKDLALQVSESVWLSVYEPHRGQIVYIAEQPSPHALRHDAPIGRSARLLDDVSGRLVLAWLPEPEVCRILGDEVFSQTLDQLQHIRRQGYAIQFEPSHDQMALIAAPIIDSSRSCVGALTLAVPVQRFKSGMDVELAAAVMAAASRVSHYLGAQLLGGASSGSWHDGIEIIADLMRDHVAGLMATPSLGGGTRNLLELAEGRGAYCMTTWSSLKSAFEGQSPFKKKHDNLRIVMNLSSLELHFVCRNDVEIESVRDITRYRVSPGLVGFSTFQLFNEILQAVELKEADFARNGGSIVHFDYPEAARQFESGNLDIIMWMTATPNNLVTGLAFRGARIVGLDDELIGRVVKNNPSYEPTEIAAMVYPGQDQPVHTIMVNTALATLSERPEFEVYDVARTLFERRDDLSRASSAYSFDAPFASATGTVPFHPGAVRYWNEAQQASTRRSVK